MDITPALHVRNEMYWIHYVLRDVLKVFGKAIMIDTGSTDATCEIAKQTADDLSAELLLLQENMGDDAVAIGQCSTRMREAITTRWMFLVDGDEIWREDKLRLLVAQLEVVPDNYECVMVGARNTSFVDSDGKPCHEYQPGGRLVERDRWVADRVFGPMVRWNIRQDYPFQSHGLEERCRRNAVYHVDFDNVFFWHVRHLQRSSQDDKAYFRNQKLGYFPTDQRSDLESNWIGEIAGYPNPYLQR